MYAAHLPPLRIISGTALRVTVFGQLPHTSITPIHLKFYHFSFLLGKEGKFWSGKNKGLPPWPARPSIIWSSTSLACTPLSLRYRVKCPPWPAHPFIIASRAPSPWYKAQICTKAKAETNLPLPALDLDCLEHRKAQWRTLFFYSQISPFDAGNLSSIIQCNFQWLSVCWANGRA